MQNFYYCFVAILYSVLLLIPRMSKKWATFVFVITSATVDRFS